MGIADDVDPWKRQNIDRENIGPNIFNMRSPAADVEKRAVRASRDQPTVVISIKDAETRLFFPNAVTLDLAWIGGEASGFANFLH